MAHKTIGTTSYVFVAAANGSYDVVLRRGTLSASAITFDGATYTVYDGSGASDSYAMPALSLSSGNYLWVGAIRQQAGIYRAYARKTNSEATGSLSSFGAASSLGSYSNSQGIAIAPLSDNRMFAVVGRSGATMRAYRHNGSSWDSSDSDPTGASGWSAPTALNGSVWAVAAYDDNYYAGGEFTSAGGDNQANYIARWNGTAWQALGSGLNEVASSLAVFNSYLFVGGAFQNAGGNSAADYLGRWNGLSWSGSGAFSGGVQSLYVSLDGGRLYAACTAADNGIKYTTDGSSWQTLSTSPPVGQSGYIKRLAEVGTYLYALGIFNNGSGVFQRSLMRADLSAEPLTWEASGGSLGTFEFIYDMKAVGEDLYLAGDMYQVDGDPALNYLVRWDGSQLNSLGTSPNGVVHSLGVRDKDLFAGGLYTMAGGVANTSGFARWDGLEWHSVGGGLPGIGHVYHILASGSQLLVGSVGVNLNGSSRTFVVFDDSLSTDSSSEYSVVSNGADMVHIVNTNVVDNVLYRTFNSSLGVWAEPTVLYGQASHSPVIGLRLVSNSVIAAWLDGALGYYRRGDVPFGAGDFESSETLFTGATANNKLTLAETSPLISAWTTGSGAPYEINTSSKTNANIISGTVSVDGAGVAGTVVELSGDGAGSDTVDSDGLFKFEAVENGQYTLTPVKAGTCFSPTSVSVTVNGDDSAGNDFSICVPTPTPTVTPTSTPSDTTAPVVTAKKASGKLGKKVTLSYELDDDSGMSSEVIVISRGKKTLKTISTQLAAIAGDGKRQIQWRAPKTNQGKLTFCVTATDSSNNTGAKSCAKIALK